MGIITEKLNDEMRHLEQEFFIHEENLPKC